MRNKILSVFLSLLLVFLFLAGPPTAAGGSIAGTAIKQFDIGNHIFNGSFGMGTAGFSSKVAHTNKLDAITEVDGNVYAAVTFDGEYQCFVSEQTSLQANTPYTFSFDYYIPSDNPNMFTYGLSTVAGHPSLEERLTANGTAPYTITDLNTDTVVYSSSGDTLLLRYGLGARTIAVDGVNRSASVDVGDWMRYSATFTLADDAPSVYFFFMSYEQGKKADGVTPLAFVPGKTVSFDNILIKGLYNVSVSAGEGGKAEMDIIDTTGYPGKVYESGRVQYTASPACQNEFVGWEDDNNNIVSTDLTYVARPNCDTHLTAIFASHNGVKTYGAEYGMPDETLDGSTTATTQAVSNTSGITSLGGSHVKVYGSSTYRYFRYNQMTLQPHTDYTLSFYMYFTGTNCHFGLFRDTGFSPDCGAVLQRANYYTTAELTLAEVTPGGETTLSTSTLHSSDYYQGSVLPTAGKWIHYTMTFNSGSFAAEDNILTASGPATPENPITATSYYTSDYDGTAYFALRYDGVPSLSSYILVDNISLTKSSSITVQPGAGGTVSSDIFGGTVSTSTTKTLQDGTYVTLTATPDSGTGFVAWVDENNSPVSYDKTFTFFVNSPRIIKPFFDSANKVHNGDFALGVSGWTAYGDPASNAAIDVLDTSDLESEHIPASPTGNSVLKLSFNRTDSLINKRVQAYSNYTFATENNKTYEISAWVYSKYNNARLSLYVPTTIRPYQQDATNDFTYVAGGYSIGATQLAGSYKYLMNDVVKSQTGYLSIYANYNRSFDVSGNQNGWTKMSIVFTTDSNPNCVQNASISLGTTSYSKNGVNYYSGDAYFADISVKTHDSYTVNNNKLGGNVTVNDKVVISSRTGNTSFGSALNLKASPYDGFLFAGWYKNSDTTPFSTSQNTKVIYTGPATYTAKYDYDKTVPNLFFDGFENLPNGADLEDTGSNDLGTWKLLSAYTDPGSYLSWGNYTVTDGDPFGITPRSGTKMLTVFGRYNASHRLIDVAPNTDYVLSFYWYQRAEPNNRFYSIAITENTDNIKFGSPAEYSDPTLTNYFVAQDYTPILSDGTWKKYTISFNSGDNTTLKLFLRYLTDQTDTANNLFLDDFSLLPVNTETSSGNPIALSIYNDAAPLNTTFRGISSTVYHCYTYMDDIYGRNYTEEMAEFEMDRLKASGVKLVRTIFKSQFAWDDTTGYWNWESDRMQAVYRWASELQDRGIDIALNAGWNHHSLIDGTSSIPEVPYLYANGNYSLACTRYAQWITEALQAFQSHGIYNITHLIVFTEPSRETPGNPEGNYAPQYVQAVNALHNALSSAGIRNNYKIVGPNQNIMTGNGLLNYVLQNCDSAIDVYSSHYYPKSATIYDDAFGTNASAAYNSFMNTLFGYSSTKDFWLDEYFSYAPNSTPMGMDSGWAGTQTAVGMTSAMNAGVENVISWMQFNQLWVDSTLTSVEFIDGIHSVGTAPSLFKSAIPFHQYYALTLMSRYLGCKNGRVYSSSAPSGSGLYIGTVKLENGSWSVMVVNTGQTSQKFQATFATAINQTLYRHLYDPETVKIDAHAKLIAADKVYTSVGTSFVDTIPSGGIAIYSGLDF